VSYSVYLSDKQDKDGKALTALTLKGAGGLSFLLAKERQP